MGQQIGWSAAFTKYVLYFALRAILRMFKMIPDHFVLLTSFGCWKEVRRAEGRGLEKGMDAISEAHKVHAVHNVDN
ncbi:hypothetical protein FX988_03143 [Paraglaciecola mesophila]|uniref:Uncharacterized protein n=1 Tax=Paraglaciecola mesophila TaxID=197222 RepID=A0A857JLD8_9ALTE|nr:hypothetical protein FX988_03143 [Paraglaciecola mesophila]